MAEVTYVKSLPEFLADLDAKGIYDVDREKAIMNFIGRKARFQGVPVFGSFELSPLCNLDCKMCYVHLTKQQTRDISPLLNVEQWKSIMTQAADAGLYSADLTGGECLLYPGFREIYLHLLSLGVRVSVLTNGRLLTDEMVAFFVKYPPELIQVTLYGSNEDAYERVTGHRAFGEVMAGIERLKVAKLKYKIAITFCKESEGDEMPLLSLVRNMNVPYTFEGAWLDARTECERCLDHFVPGISRMAELKKSEMKYRAASLKSNRENYRECIYDYPSQKKLGGLPCGGGHSSFQINWRGEMNPCPSIADVRINVLEYGFSDAWKKLQNKMIEWSAPVECKSCRYEHVCNSCPGEKTRGKFQESLNTLVCRRLEKYIDEGIVKQP
ncbi:MAG: radical SAM protein [Aristaeellaceae bacterium]